MNDKADEDELIQEIRIGVRCTRADAERRIGKDAVKRLIATAKLSHNPFTDLIELARPTEDFYP